MKQAINNLHGTFELSFKTIIDPDAGLIGFRSFGANNAMGK